MQRCWKLAPTDRPTFTALQKYIGDYKYVPANSIFFRLKGSTEDQSDCSVDVADDIHLCQPPPEVAKLFDQSSNGRNHMMSQDRWSNDDLYNTMRTVDTELQSDQSSGENYEDKEETVKVVQMRDRDGHKPRDRRQKRSLVFPATMPNVAFADTVTTDPQAQQKPSDRTDGPSKEMYTPSPNSSSKLFKSNPLNMYLEPAYKELLIPSESESSLDTDIMINTNNLHKQGGYRYAYP